jgi:hypothetical protein
LAWSLLLCCSSQGLLITVLNGQGSKTFADGDQYISNFKDDKRHEQGTYIFTDIGTVAEGVWESGCLKKFAFSLFRSEGEKI